MKVRLEDIPPEGLEVEFGDRQAQPQDLGDQVVSLPETPWASLLLERRAPMVLAKGRYKARVGLECSRCLRPFETELEGPLEWVFMPPPDHRGEEVRLGDEDLDVIFYEDGELDLAQSLRDEISLALPLAPLCREQCPGLCPVCGKYQEDGACGCRPKEMDPRWAKLARLDEH